MKHTKIRSRRRFAGLPAAVAAIALLAALPAAAEIYHVRLATGGEFETRYQPEEASWDTSQLLILTDVGNWISLAKDTVVEITTETENKGYGRVIDTTTIALGRSPNDAEVPGDNPPQEVSTMDALRAMLDRPQQNYSVEQFVEPSQAGGGLPVTYGFGYVPPGAVNP